MELDKSEKVDRVLGMYIKLANGEVINRSQEAKFYGVTERTIQRDVDDLRNFFENDKANEGFTNNLV